MVVSALHIRAVAGWLTDNAEPEAGQKEIYSSWALFILLMLLILALFASYMLQHKKIQAVHETVISIFAGGTLAAGTGFEQFRRLSKYRHGSWSHHKVDRGNLHPRDR